jgi:hypothetical protein
LSFIVYIYFLAPTHFRLESAAKGRRTGGDGGGGRSGEEGDTTVESVLHSTEVKWGEGKWGRCEPLHNRGGRGQPLY